MLDVSTIYEMWEVMRDDIQEKNRVNILKNMLIVLEDHGQVNYNVMQDLREMDNYLQQAVDIIYKEFDDEEEELEEEWDEYD